MSWVRRGDLPGWGVLVHGGWFADAVIERDDGLVDVVRLGWTSAEIDTTPGHVAGAVVAVVEPEPNEPELVELRVRIAHDDGTVLADATGLMAHRPGSQPIGIPLAFEAPPGRIDVELHVEGEIVWQASLDVRHRMPG
jgi:hypothetical protein